MIYIGNDKIFDHKIDRLIGRQLIDIYLIFVN